MFNRLGDFRDQLVAFEGALAQATLPRRLRFVVGGTAGRADSLPSPGEFQLALGDLVLARWHIVALVDLHAQDAFPMHAEVAAILNDVAV
jgi:hypothetical protein